jgi:predicted DsbA family dithiol-disulfide isomerase
MEPIRIFYFSDVLCVWAYIAQIRLEELKAEFSENIVIDYHFVSVFGNAREKLTNGWRDRGGLGGYSNHVKATASKFEHISVHPDIWKEVVPASSTSVHLFLRAVHLLEVKGLVPKSNKVLEKTAWAFREAFFTKLVDISDRQIQFKIAKKLGLPKKEIQSMIDSGEAYASLSKDLELVKEHHVTVSPTLIFNEGRQRLNGNVGYRVIEANIRELLHNPPDENSWC